MAFEEGTARLDCQGCGAVHLAKWSRNPVRERHKIRCQSCNRIIAEGSSLRDYYEITIVGPPADPSNTEKDTTHG